MKKLTKEEFITRGKLVHNNKFNYSRVVYVNPTTPVIIICPIHGEYKQTPSAHLRSIAGCPKCSHIQGSKKIRGEKKPLKLLHGVGFNDDNEIHSNKYESIAYRKWRTMLARCYNENYQKKQGTYIGCSVCKEWLTFSNFKEWHDNNYKKGYELDKDILSKGNKIYSPQTCCYVPKEINTLLLSCKSVRGDLPIGVIRHKIKNNTRYVSQFSTSYNGKRENKYLGSYDTPQEAFSVYKQAKEQYIKDIASKYFIDGKITEKVYKALMNYEVEITD